MGNTRTHKGVAVSMPRWRSRAVIDENCDMLCVRSCARKWEPCVVIADHGTYCDVRMSDGAMIAGVVNRFLRWPALPGVSKRARRNLSGEVLV